MNRKYKYTFDFFDTIEQAEKMKAGILNIYKNNRYYIKKYANKFHIGEWTSTDKTEHKIIMHYYY